MNTHTLGQGQLNWTRYERIGDRYGHIGLYNDAHPDRDGDPHPVMAWDGKGQELVGKKGKLRAVILETRQSAHIGDMFNGLVPGGASVGDVIELGVGTLFTADEYGPRVGVKPEDGRSTFWMNPVNLYKCHQQTVRLEFVVGDMDMEPWLKEE